MGKKSKILYYSVLIVNLVFFILDLLPINFPFFKISFGVSLMLIGLLLIVRSANFKIDSSLFFGGILLMIGVLNLVGYFGVRYFALDLNELWPYYVLSVSFGGLITYICFKDKLQFKLFMLFLGFGLITLLFVRQLVVLWLYVVLMVLWFIGYFIVNTIVYKRGKNRWRD